MIRFLLVAIILFSFLILSIPILIYEHFLAKKDLDKLLIYLKSIYRLSANPRLLSVMENQFI